MRQWLFKKLHQMACNTIAAREPDIIIGSKEDPYLKRWYVVKSRLFNVYVHNFLRSDDDRALHDHPWMNCSLLLEGAYMEVTQRGYELLHAGDYKLRLSGKHAHRIYLHAGSCWTLFITGPKYREWGFLCPKGWRHWRDFTAEVDGHSVIGRGCE